MKPTAQLERDVVEAALKWSSSVRVPAITVAETKLVAACALLKARRKLQATPPRPKKTA